MEPMIDLQLENVEIRVHETPDGYLIAWGDYIANTWLHGCETMAETFTWLAMITADAQEYGDRTAIYRTLKAQPLPKPKREG